MTTLILFTAGIGFCVGVAVLWANPDRFANQMFSIISLTMFLALLLAYETFKASDLFKIDNTTSPVPWLRASAMLTGMFPWMLWMLKESFITVDNERLRTLRRSLPWLCMGLGLAAISYTDWYIPSDSLPSNPKRGAAFVFRITILIATFLFLVIQSSFQMKKQIGIRRIEMQFFVLNLGVSIFFSTSLAFLSNVFGIPALRHLSFIVIFISYILASWAIAFYRVFDVPQVLLALTQRAGLVLILGLGVVLSKRGLENFIPSSGALLLTGC